MGDEVSESMQREAALRPLVTAYILAGLLFMLLPGTFLGVWNLVSISSQRGPGSLSPEWLQAHGHAQIFGWIGSFILGIGFYSSSKMARLPSYALRRGWFSWVLWTGGVLLRWATNLYLWRWRAMLPVSAALELAAFLIFFRTVSRHRSGGQAARPQAWMIVAIGATLGLLLALGTNFGVAVWLAMKGTSPAIPHALDQRLLALASWGFLVPFIWAFNARWLPVFLGLPDPFERGLLAAFAINAGAVASALAAFLPLSAALAMIGAVSAILALHVFEPATRPAKTQDVHPSFPYFVRGAYGWLLVSAGLAMWAVTADRSGGIWGASRHALTVGFVSTMVFAIGQRVLPAFCGGRVLYSKTLMLGSLLLLNLGCFLRVSSEIPAYEGYARQAWTVLPVSAVVELAGVTLFAANLGATLLRRPARPIHLAEAAA